jgi:hypothetical protein
LHRVSEYGESLEIVQYRRVSQSRVAVAEAQGQLRNTEEGALPPMEAITRRLVKTQQAEKTYVCALVKCKVHRTVTA